MTQVTGPLFDEVGNLLANTTCLVQARDDIIGQDGGGRVKRGVEVTTSGAGIFDADIKPGEYTLTAWVPSVGAESVTRPLRKPMTVLDQANQSLQSAFNSDVGDITPSVLQQAAQFAADAEASAERAELATDGFNTSWYLRGDGRALDLVVDMQRADSYTVDGSGGVTGVTSLGFVPGLTFTPDGVTESPTRLQSGFRGLVFDGGSTYAPYSVTGTYPSSLFSTRLDYFALATVSFDAIATGTNQMPFSITDASDASNVYFRQILINDSGNSRHQYGDGTTAGNVQLGEAPRVINQIISYAAWNDGTVCAQWLDGICFQINDPSTLGGYSTTALIDTVTLGGLTGGATALNGALLTFGFDNSGEVSLDAAYAKTLAEFVGKGGNRRASTAVVALGQSNSGGDFGPNPDPVTIPAGAAFMRNNQSGFSGRFRRDAVSHTDTSIGASSPALYFADEWRRITGHVMLFNQLAFGGVPVSPGLTGTTQYHAPKNSVGDAASQTSILEDEEHNFRRMAALNKYSPEFDVRHNIGFIVQGEADAAGIKDEEVTAAEVKQYFTAWLNALSAKYGIRTFAIVKLGRRGINQTQVDDNAASLAAVNTVWDELIAERDDCLLAFEHPPQAATYTMDNLVVDDDGAWISGYAYTDGVHYAPKYFRAIGITAARNIAAQLIT